MGRKKAGHKFGNLQKARCLRWDATEPNQASSSSSTLPLECQTIAKDVRSSSSEANVNNNCLDVGSKRVS